MLPAILHATEIVRSGQIGTPISIHVDFYFSKDAGPPKGSRNASDPPISWLDFQRAAHSDGSDGAVGTQPMGELQNEGVYALAYIKQIMGCEFRRVFARTTAAFHQVNVDNGVEDFATVSLELSDGMVATMAVGRIGAASHPDIGEIKLAITGTEGALVVAEARPEVGVYYRGQPEKEFRHQRVAIDNDYLLMENFASAIDVGGSSLMDVHASRMITATVVAALRSAQSGRFEVVD